MKKYEILIEDSKASELKQLLEQLPYVRQVKESESDVDIYSLASEESLGEDWNLQADDELQKLYGK